MCYNLTSNNRGIAQSLDTTVSHNQQGELAMLKVETVMNGFFEHSVRSVRMDVAHRYLRIYAGTIHAYRNDTFGGVDIFLHSADGKVIGRIASC